MFQGLTAMSCQRRLASKVFLLKIGRFLGASFRWHDKVVSTTVSRLTSYVGPAHLGLFLLSSLSLRDRQRARKGWVAIQAGAGQAKDDIFWTKGGINVIIKENNDNNHAARVFCPVTG